MHVRRNRSLWTYLFWRKPTAIAFLLFGCIVGASLHVQQSPLGRAGLASHASIIASAPAADTTQRDTTQRWDEDAWAPIYQTDGVQFAYIFYPEARGERGGVVVRVRNTNAHAICYRFTIIFRGPYTEREATAHGPVPPHTLRTGDDDGLFWAPFTNNERIGEIGLRGVRVRASQTGTCP